MRQTATSQPGLLHSLELTGTSGRDYVERLEAEEVEPLLLVSAQQPAQPSAARVATPAASS